MSRRRLNAQTTLTCVALLMAGKSGLDAAHRREPELDRLEQLANKFAAEQAAKEKRGDGAETAVPEWRDRLAPSAAAATSKWLVTGTERR
jgi:hypothetical protein